MYVGHNIIYTYIKNIYIFIEIDGMRNFMVCRNRSIVKINGRGGGQFIGKDERSFNILPDLN